MRYGSWASELCVLGDPPRSSFNSVIYCVRGTLRAGISLINATDSQCQYLLASWGLSTTLRDLFASSRNRSPGAGSPSCCQLARIYHAFPDDETVCRGPGTRRTSALDYHSHTPMSARWYQRHVPAIARLLTGHNCQQCFSVFIWHKIEGFCYRQCWHAAFGTTEIHLHF